MFVYFFIYIYIYMYTQTFILDAINRLRALVVSGEQNGQIYICVFHKNWKEIQVQALRVTNICVFCFTCMYIFN